MTRYWVIAPYDFTKKETFANAWDFDLRNGTIAVGWRDLGDTSNLSREQLEEKYEKAYADPTRKGLNQISRFWHEIIPGDILIARGGRKKILSWGTVTGSAYYDDAKGKERVKDQQAEQYPNFVPVQWVGKEKEFEDMVFSFTTLYEISEERFRNLLGDEPDSMSEGQSIEQTQEFALEKYLEEFIVTNFRTIFDDRLRLYTDPEGNSGRQYSTDVGRIDILATEPATKSYVVIELKKGQESDKVVGQTLRYMGWVKEHICEGNEGVRGLIICRESDERLRYALSVVPEVEVRFYEVNFRLLQNH
ncbi:MAG: DUF1016 family protein [Chloroflexi bacterium]|nr:DUF1016 family protein [Chloroflexota bacterium]